MKLEQITENEFKPSRFKNFLTTISKGILYATIPLAFATSSAGLLSCDNGDNSLQDCVYNSECKGARICVNNECVNPPEEPETVNEDNDNDGFKAIIHGGTDCDDFDDFINPEQTDWCDGVDNNCNNLTDEIGCGKIYFIRGNGTIFNINLSTSEETEIPYFSTLQNFNFSHFPKISPDNSKVSFVDYDLMEGQGILYYLDIATSTVNKIVEGPGVGEHSWLSNNKMVYSGRMNGPKDIMVSIDLDGSNKQILYTKPLAESASGLYLPFDTSPEGKIAFSISPNGTKALREIYLMNGDGDNLMRLTNNGGCNFGPVFGGADKIYYTCSPEDCFPDDKNLCSISLDGSNQKLEFEKYYGLLFSPDNSKALMFGRGVEDKVWDFKSSELFQFPWIDYNSLLTWRK
ncbi:hypothetical protein HON71_03340 [Candidatus Woesearchaeota archaeon]|jgi:hypothetical protein|nr:hypothetical protein [Candidatus Woesearchaeota archaeon]MBT5342336.1 hypothetical protein [Candidatus Woesearchaeota archaeon]